MKTFVTLLALVLAAVPAIGQDDAKKIDQLVEQLGADDFQARESADKELRKIGDAAVPALKKALESSDAERADRAKKILDAIATKKKEEQPKKDEHFVSSFLLRDLTRGLTFKMEDGKVEVTVPENDEKSGKKV